MKLSNNAKNATVIVIVLLVALAVYVTLYNPPEPVVFDKGSEINGETFIQLFGDASKIYIVMDLKDSSSNLVSTNILQCGVDFAGSMALAGKNVTYISMDEKECYVGDIVNGGSGGYTTAECIRMLDNGITFYIHEGDTTKYYTKAADIGVNQYYMIGTCAITVS